MAEAAKLVEHRHGGVDLGLRRGLALVALDPVAPRFRDDAEETVRAGFALPLIRPVVGYWTVLCMSGMLIWMFPLVYALTRGGPGSATETISIYAYIRGFQEFDTSYIAAVVVVLAILFSVGLVVVLKRMAIAR